MELRHLRAFLTVAEELHFGRAAARLHMSQPPLSQQVQRLERELGVELFRRNRRHVELTAAGSALVPEARRTLAAADRRRAAVACGRGRLVGRLELGFVGSTAHGVLPRLVRALRERAPGVEIALRRGEHRAADRAPAARAARRGARAPADPGRGHRARDRRRRAAARRAARRPPARRSSVDRARASSRASRSCCSRARSGPGCTTRSSGSAAPRASARTSSTRAPRRPPWSRWSRRASGSSVLPASHAGTGSARFVPLAGGEVRDRDRARLVERERRARARRAACRRTRRRSAAQTDRSPDPPFWGRQPGRDSVDLRRVTRDRSPRPPGTARERRGPRSRPVAARVPGRRAAVESHLDAAGIVALGLDGRARIRAWSRPGLDGAGARPRRAVAVGRAVPASTLLEALGLGCAAVTVCGPRALLVAARCGHAMPRPPAARAADRGAALARAGPCRDDRARCRRGALRDAHRGRDLAGGDARARPAVHARPGDIGRGARLRAPARRLRLRGGRRGRRSPRSPTSSRSRSGAATRSQWPDQSAGRQTLAFRVALRPGRGRL